MSDNETNIAVLKTEFKNLEKRQEERFGSLHGKIERVADALDKKTDKIHEAMELRADGQTDALNLHEDKFTKQARNNLVFAFVLCVMLVSQFPELISALKLIPVVLASF